MASAVDCSLTSVYEYATRDNYVACQRRNTLIIATIVTAIALLVAVISLVNNIAAGEPVFGFGTVLLFAIPIAWTFYATQGFFAERAYDVSRKRIESLRALYPKDSDAEIAARLRQEERVDTQIDRLSGLDMKRRGTQSGDVSGVRLL